MKSIFLADNYLYTCCWALMCLSYHTLGSLNHSVAFWQNHPCLLLKVYHKCSRFERHIKTRPVDAGYILYCIAWFCLFFAIDFAYFLLSRITKISLTSIQVNPLTHIFIIWLQDSHASVDLGAIGRHSKARLSASQSRAPHQRESGRCPNPWGSKIRSSWTRLGGNLRLLLTSCRGTHNHCCSHILPWTQKGVLVHLSYILHLLLHLLYLLHHPTPLLQKSSTTDPCPLHGVHEPPDKLSSGTQTRLILCGKCENCDKVERGGQGKIRGHPR